MKFQSTPHGLNRLNRLNRKIVLCGAVALSVLGCCATARGQDIRVTIDGEQVQFQDIGPQQISGRTMVPVRGVLEKLGANVSYNGQTHTVIASTPGIDIQLVLGSTNAIVNAAPVTLDVPAQTINDHTFVPLRFLGEALGAEIKWDPDTCTVIIKTNHRDHDRDDHDRPGRDHAPPPTTFPDPVINSFMQTSGKWLRAGQPLEVTLDGTPGGQAAFRVPGLVDDVPMREAQPGHYIGLWSAPADRPVCLNSAAVIGSLKIGPKLAPLIQAGQTLSVDTVPPKMRDIAPENQTNVSDLRPNISAALDDEGSGIDRDSIKLIVNGVDVTGRATVTRDFVSYRPETPLPAGQQQVELRLRDLAGNNGGGQWTFVEQRRPDAGIRSISDNVDHILRPGDTIHVEMEASSGARAWFSTGTIQNVALAEDRPGHYTANYTIRTGDDISDKPIAFHLITRDGQKFEQASAHVVRVTTGKPEPPTITSPAPNQIVGNPLVVSGRARRNSRIHVKVEFKNRVLGVLSLQGTTAEVVVVADRDGNWQTQPINLGLAVANRGTEFTISATSINGAGDTSDATLLRFKIQ